MKNKKMVILCSILLAVSVLSFTDDKQRPALNVLVPVSNVLISDSSAMGPGSNVLIPDLNALMAQFRILVNERADEKATFDYNQAIYHNKANTRIRAENLVAQEEKTDEQEKEKVEETQDKTKGQFLWKF